MVSPALVGATPYRHRGASQVVEGLADYRIVMVSCGGRHTAAIENGGGLFTWGLASTGALGLGTTRPETRQDVWEPRRVESMRKEPVFAVGCGAAHTVVLSLSGVAYVALETTTLCCPTPPH